MKRNIFHLIVGTICVAIFSFNPVAVAGNKDKDTKKQAEVNQSNGIYIFVQSRPVQDYDVLGTVEKKGVVVSGRPREMFKTIIRRAKRDYPECEGVIFDNLQLNHASCIKFR